MKQRENEKEKDLNKIVSKSNLRENWENNIYKQDLKSQLYTFENNIERPFASFLYCDKTLKKNSNNSSNISTLKILENKDEIIRMKSKMNIELDKVLDIPSKKRILSKNEEVTDVILGVRDSERFNKNSKNMGKKLIHKFELDDHVKDILIGNESNKSVKIRKEGKFNNGRKLNYEKHLKSKIEIK